jgi:hypothetical protein
MKNLQLTKSQRVDALDWILDCCFSEDDVEIANSLDDAQIERTIEKKFCGGIKGFLESYNEN